MSRPPRTRKQVDAIVLHAWSEGAWTLQDFRDDTGLEDRTIEESCLRLYKSKQVNFDPEPQQPKGKNHGNRIKTRRAPRGR